LSVKFGTSGLRGLSTDLIGQTTATYVTAFAQYLLGSGRAVAGADVFCGMDFRDSSPSIASTAMQSLAQAGLNPVNVGALPTPSLAYFAMQHGSAALMVTGSHIPADRNGIKFYRPDGEIDKDDEADIVSRAEAVSKAAAMPELEKQVFEDRSAAVDAMFAARNDAILPANSLAGLHIGVYQHSTVARDMLSKLLGHYGAKVTNLGRSESFIPVDTEAVSVQTLALLRNWAFTAQYDAFVSADGDGDRPLVADETGTPIRGDIIGLLTAEFLRAKTIVTPVTSNSCIEREFNAKVKRTRVGSPYVIAGMNEALAHSYEGVMGFEANGGVLTASIFEVAKGHILPLPTRDSVLPILAMLNFCKTRNQPLSHSVLQRRFAVTDSDRLENFPPEKSTALMKFLTTSDENISAFLKDIGKVAATSKIDGLRVALSDRAIIHFRPSGNAPELRCYTEATSAGAARDLLKRGLEAAAAFPTT
jgi:phosphomannomutase